MIKIENISKSFQWKKDRVKALNGVSLEIGEGDIYGIIGFSGAGKSTLVRMINGLEKPDSGTVHIDNIDVNKIKKHELTELRKTIGMVFQQFNLLNSKTVYDNVAMPLVLNKKEKNEIRKRVTELLEFVGLSDKADSYPSQLSGGQKQRVGIARALANNPRLLLCDEATSALDPKTTDAILDLLKKINDDMGITIVIITHEMHVIQKICNKVAVMENGCVIEKGNVKDVFTNPKENITKGFVDMIVKEDIPGELLKLVTETDNIHQIWSVKYWGENRTLQMIDELKRTSIKDIQLLYSTTSVLRDNVLNIFAMGLQEKEDRGELISETLSKYDVLLERKDYEL